MEAQKQSVTNELRCGFVALAGPPNVGKSTLMNRILGQKVSITTSRPQTTRNRIIGVSTLPGRGQIVYVDTPGLHKPHKALNALMVDNALKSIRDTELILFLIDVTDGFRGEEVSLSNTYRAVARQIAQMGLPVIVVLNKIDRLKDRNRLLPMLSACAKIDLSHRDRLAPTAAVVEGEGEEGVEPAPESEGPFLEPVDLVPVSAQTGEGVERLQEVALSHLSVAPLMYPADMVTDQAERFLASEIVREKLMLQTRKELPYSTAVVVTDFLDDERRNLLKLRGVIHVERDSQKAIVIGEGGQRLKQVGSQARAELEQIFGRKIFLELHVKVEKDWSQDALALKRLGYVREEK